MPILNMVGGGKKGGNIGEPLNLTVTTSGLDATIKWEDNEIGTIPPTTFQKSELVRKIGSAPTSPSDGDLVVTETVKDTYKTIGYVDQGLTEGETYYYRVFSYSDLGGISYCDAVSVTPSPGRQPGANTIAYYPLTSTTMAQDVSGNNHNGTNNGVIFDSTSGVNCGYFNGTSYIQIPDSASLSGGANFSVGAWYKYSGGGNIAIDIIGKGQFHTYWIMRVLLLSGRYGNVQAFMVASDPSTYQETEVAAQDSLDGGWHNLFFSWEAGNTNTLKLYYDGQHLSDVSNSYTYNYNDNTSDMYIGQQEDGSYKFNGYISNIIIESKSRTAQEISDYYNQTKGDYGIS